MQSQAVLEEAVEQLGVQTLLDRPAEADKDRAKAVEQLENNITVDGGRDSRVITASCSAKSPALARKFLSGYLDAFHRKHLQAHRSSGTVQFFREQTELLKRQLEDASAELRDAKNAVDLVSIEGERKFIEEQKGTISTEIVTARSQLDATQAEIAAEERLLASLPERMLTEEVQGLPEDPLGATERRLYELRLREQELLARYTKKHPLVISIRQQIDEAEQIIGQRGKAGSQQTSAANPTFMKLADKLLTDKARAASLEAKLASLNQQYRDLRQRLKALNEHEGRIERLRQQVDVLKKSFATYSAKLEQARMDQALQLQRISNVSVFQPPTLPVEPSFPPTALMLLAGVFVGAFTGVGSAFVREYAELFRASLPEDDLTDGDRNTDAEFVAEHDDNPADGVNDVQRLVEQATL